MYKLIDAHIHLDQYHNDEINTIMNEPSIEAVISVSMHLKSCQRNFELHKRNSSIKPCYGFHPEQILPAEKELAQLFEWIDTNQMEMAAIGEVGLPYYLRTQQPHSSISLVPYLELLERFILSAKKYDKPIVLHAIYEDADKACNLLEKHSFSKAHFHWFKGNEQIINRMKENGYFISITPDVFYEKEIQDIVRSYPINQIMVETDGPWPFEGPFSGKMTHPSMINQSIKMISNLKNAAISELYQTILQNTRSFYKI